MRLILTFSLLLALGACEHVPKNRNDGYVPAAQQCPVDMDPACAGEATVGVQIPLREAPSPSNPMAGEHAIVGRCELYVEGEEQARPCKEIKLIVRATRENEVRTAVIDGYNFKVSDLNKTDYAIEAASPGYEVQTDSKLLSPGQTVKIRVRAKPRP